MRTKCVQVPTQQKNIQHNVDIEVTLLCPTTDINSQSKSESITVYTFRKHSALLTLRIL